MKDALIDPFYPRFWPERLPVYFQGKPKGVFVCDMSDLFGIGVPEAWTRAVLGTIRHSPMGWRFYLLTKRPQELLKWSPFPSNCYVGVTVTTAEAMMGAQFLAQVEASVKFLSLEPLLEQIPINMIGAPSLAVDWLIIGAQGHPALQPRIEWIREIIEAADRVGIPVFLKNNLWPLGPSGWMRQEMPDA